MNNIKFDQETWNKLTPRELEIAKAAADDLLTKETSGRLNISVKTVEVHRHNILKKLNAKTMAGVVAILIRGKIIA